MPSTTKLQDAGLVKLLLKEMTIDLDASFDASLVVDWVADNFAPEEVYGEAALKHWAWDNGFVEEEEEKEKYMMGRT